MSLKETEHSNFEYFYDVSQWFFCRIMKKWKYEFLQSVIGSGYTEFLIFFKKNKKLIQTLIFSFNHVFFPAGIQKFWAIIFIFLRVHFVTFHEIGCFERCRKNQIAYGA